MSSQGNRSADFRIEQAAQQYSAATDIHGDLPPSYIIWGKEYLERPLVKLWGVQSAEEFYIGSIVRVLGGRLDAHLRILSIGCGECSSEIELCSHFASVGYRNIRFTCVDIAAGAIQRAESHARALGLDGFFQFQVGLYDDFVAQSWDVVIANQFLHHVVGLESLFDAIQRAIGETGIFLSNDMIGRNGHMLWPEALAIVDRLWEGLPDRYKMNHVLGRMEAVYSNWDNSKEANEGIRAQDILPELIKRFHFDRFFAAGNLAIAILSRHFGPNFNPHDPDDLALIEQIGRLDHDLIDIGYLKPVLMYACMSNRPGPSEIYRHWSPEFCVRRVPPSLGSSEPATMSPGDTIFFRQRSNTIDMLKGGWSSAEEDGVWSNEDASELDIVFAQALPAGLCALEIHGIQFLPSTAADSPISVSVNGVPVGLVGFQSQHMGASRATVIFDNPSATTRASIKFDYAQCWTPEELGFSADRRRLAFRLISLRLSKLP